MAILDRFGKPMKAQELLKDHAAPTLSGVRSIWGVGVASGLTPVDLAQILKSAAEGNANKYLTLAEEMEERDPHYASVLGTRKRAITSLPISVEAAGESPTDKKIAEAVLQLTKSPVFVDMLRDLLDGLGKGYCAVEIGYLQNASEWSPKTYTRRDPRFFQFDKRTGMELRIRDEDAEDGLELQPYKFIVHCPKLKSGIPIRNGLARLVAWSFIFKSYTVKDWMAFLEVYGLPVRVGRYNRDTATEDDKRILLRAVANIGTDAAAIIDKSMEIEFIKSEGGRGEAVFGSMADFLDRQVSKAVLGQTMTTDDGSSQAQAKVHDEVRGDIRDDDALQLTNAINRDLTIPFVDLNFGPQEAYPVVKLLTEEQEDLTALAGNVEILVRTGMGISESEVREKFGFRAPKPGEKILGAMTPTVDGDNKTETATARAQPCSSCGVAHGRTQQTDALDELIDHGLGDWEKQIDPLLAPLRALANEVSDYDELMARLPELYPDLDEAEIIAALSKATAMARALGDVRDN